MTLAVSSAPRDRRGGKRLFDRKPKASPAPQTGTAATGSLIFADLSGAPLAVWNARPETCRYPTGEGETFRYCGAPATEIAGGKIIYCAACAGTMRGGRSAVKAPSAHQPPSTPA